MSALATLAVEIGAKSLHKVLTDKIGAKNADLADAAVRAVATRVGVAPDDLPAAIEDRRPAVIDAAREVDRMTPELAAVYQKGIELQIAELASRETDPIWTWAWRPFWMWSLLALWVWALFLRPLLSALTGIVIEAIDMSVLSQLTGVFLALYMGGHTLKSLLVPGDKS